MNKEKLFLTFDYMLFFLSLLSLLFSFFDYGFYLAAPLKRMLYTSLYILSAIFILDNIIRFFSSGVKNVFREEKMLYFITFFLILQFILIKFNIYNLIFCNVEKSFFYVIVSQVYLFYMFLVKLSKVNKHFILSVKLTPVQLFVLSFILIIFLGTLMLMMPKATVGKMHMPFLDALFTSTSAVCVTGLIVKDTAVYFTLFGKIIILILIQIGGLGLMTFTSFLTVFFFKKMSFKEQFVMGDLLNYDKFGEMGGLIKKILFITFTIESLGAILLFSRFIRDYSWPTALFNSIFHSVSAFCNAGFSTFSDSLVKYAGDPLVNVVITSLIIFGGLGFLVIIELFRPQGERKRILSVHSKIVLTTTFSLIVFGTFFIFFMEYGNSLSTFSFGKKLLVSYFQSVTTRTAGFNTINIASLSAPVLFFMIFFMFIGASPGSTGGGIKTTTFGVLVATLWATLRSKESIEVFKRRLASRVIFKAISLAMISLLYLFVVFVVLLSTQKGSFLEILFEIVSAFGTVGLSMGFTSSLTILGKIIIIITMFIGRLGPITLALALSKRNKSLYKYPEEGNIMIG